MRRHNGILLAMVVLAGCAGPRIAAPPVGEPEEREVMQLIDYAQRVATMTAEQQRRELNANSQAFARDKDAMSRMRLALLFAAPGAVVHDAARAASMLEPLAAPNNAPTPLRSFARLLYAQLNESMSEQRRAKQMRDQLEALKEVERSMMGRGQESQPRRR